MSINIEDFPELEHVPESAYVDTSNHQIHSQELTNLPNETPQTINNSYINQYLSKEEEENENMLGNGGNRVYW